MLCWQERASSHALLPACPGLALTAQSRTGADIERKDLNTLYSTLSCSIELFEEAASTPPFFIFFFSYVASVQIFLLIGTFSIVSLPQSICPTNSAVSQGLLCHLNVCQESQWSFRPLERTLVLTAEVMNKSLVKQWSFLEPCFRVSRLETMLKFSIR